jgi:outer membrane protein assembly factor BamB
MESAMWAIRSAAFAAVCGLFPSIVHARPVEWSTAVGGNSARTGAVDAGGPDTPTILWQGCQLSEIAQPPVIHGRILVTTRVATLDDTLHGATIVARDLRSGRLLWSRDLPVEAPATDSRVRVVAAARGLVFATRSGDTNAGALYALRIDTGEQVWRSRATIDESAAESPAITPEGDLIVGNYRSLVRINGADGTTMWTALRLSPCSDAGAPALAADRVYTWEATVQGPKVTAFRAGTGERLYSSCALGRGVFQQIGLMVGPGPTVYAPRADSTAGADSLVALRDTGAALLERWRTPLAYAPCASMGIGPDGSVYSYAPGRSVVRIHPDDGRILARSAPLLTDNFQPRMAIDRDGNLYISNGGYELGSLASFGPNLALRWSIPTPNVGPSGPALAAPGILVLCGSDEQMWTLGSRLASCGADWNSDGVIDARDLMEFLKAFFEGVGDYNADGVTDSIDLFAFLTAFSAGC